MASSSVDKELAEHARRAPFPERSFPTTFCVSTRNGERQRCGAAIELCFAPQPPQETEPRLLALNCPTLDLYGLIGHVRAGLWRQYG